MAFKNQVMKIIFLAFFSFLGSVLHAQGNLQFNQVIRVVEVLQTVPTGKVWKVESYLENELINSNSSSSSCTSSTIHRPLIINNGFYYFIGDVAWGSTNSLQMMNHNKFPIWLKSGDQIRTTCSSDFASVIEFNIVP